MFLPVACSLEQLLDFQPGMTNRPCQPCQTLARIEGIRTKKKAPQKPWSTDTAIRNGLLQETVPYWTAWPKTGSRDTETDKCSSTRFASQPASHCHLLVQCLEGWLWWFVHLFKHLGLILEYSGTETTCCHARAHTQKYFGLASINLIYLVIFYIW